jgi:hypothetical protein
MIVQFFEEGSAFAELRDGAPEFSASHRCMTGSQFKVQSIRRKGKFRRPPTLSRASAAFRVSLFDVGGGFSPKACDLLR